MGLNKNYIVGIYDDSVMSTNITQHDKYKEITEFFTRFKYFGPIIVKKSVNEVLDEALKHEVDYCIVQSVGHIIKDALFFKFIEKYIKDMNFFVTGHIMDKEAKNSQNPQGNGYYGLHKQCMLVNLRYYEKFDKPVFGDKTATKEEIVAKALRHVVDIHDDLKREVAFYDTALEAVHLARGECERAGIPFTRPDDFFAEMIKTDGECYLQ